MLEERKENLVEGVAIDYKKVSELSADEIKTLDFYPVEFIRIEGKDRKGKVYTRYSYKLTLCKEFTHQETFEESDFYNIAYNVASAKLKMDPTKENYKINCPVRFVIGNQQDENGEVREYVLVQVIVDKGIVYSFFINKKDHKLDLFNTFLKLGKIKVSKWYKKDIVISQDEQAIALFGE